jgi:2-hydroxychromene-2-carboxylate isomerase
MRTVDFYFGIGSRYSYLAATQVAALEHDTGARVVWHPLFSRELIERAGNDPFRKEGLRGQYDPAYRSRDASRWAEFLGVPYREPEWARVDWKRLALACVAADRMGKAASFALKLFAACFAGHDGAVDDDTLASIARDLGEDPAVLARTMFEPETERVHTANITAAHDAGAFGVPTFVVDDGELFWGQDRLPLLRHHLLRKK